MQIFLTVSNLMIVKSVCTSTAPPTGVDWLFLETSYCVWDVCLVLNGIRATDQAGHCYFANHF